MTRRSDSKGMTIREISSVASAAMGAHAFRDGCVLVCFDGVRDHVVNRVMSALSTGIGDALNFRWTLDVEKAVRFALGARDFQKRLVKLHEQRASRKAVSANLSRRNQWLRDFLADKRKINPRYTHARMRVDLGDCPKPPWLRNSGRLRPNGALLSVRSLEPIAP